MIKLLAYTLIIVGVLNFASYIITESVLGGQARIGKTTGDRYYLASHGSYTEVSRSIFEYSKVHEISNWVTGPLVFVGAFILIRRNERGSRGA
jgi:hypothetical protein